MTTENENKNRKHATPTTYMPASPQLSTSTGKIVRGFVGFGRLPNMSNIDYSMFLEIF